MNQRISLFVISLLVVLLISLGGAAHVLQAQESTSKPVATPAPSSTVSPSPAASASPQAVPAAQPSPKVIAIQGHLELDDIIEVDLEHFAEWAAQNNPTKLVPYINGRAVRGDYPEEIHASRGHLQFHLQITPENKDVWVDLLGEPHGLRKLVAFSVGPEDKAQFDSVFDKKNEILLTVISPTYGVIALLVVLFTLILFIWLARTTNLIREPGECPVPKKLRPYNLGRTQMAFWFFLLYMSYLVIWLVTAALDTITASLLGLMGISAGTALSEALIDSGKIDATTNQMTELTAEKQSLEQTLADLQSQVDALNAKASSTPEDLAGRDDLSKQLQDGRTRLAQINQQIQSLTRPASATVSQGFLRDILSDFSGYSFHRFQIFAWTIVLGIMFVSSVYNNLTMPEFSATLLGLMGISSGTYIGFKFPEKK